MSTPRRRGRPRAGEATGRERILHAAVAEFEARGYDGATMRGIAAAAGVDAALVHHHFGSKADLFGEAVGTPMRPDRLIVEILHGPREHTGERLARGILTIWESPAVRKRGVALLRGAVGSEHGADLLAGFLRREVLGRIVDELGTPDADLRAGLVASQIAGLLATRYVLRVPPMSTVSIDELVAWVGPTLQRYLTASGAGIVDDG